MSDQPRPKNPWRWSILVTLGALAFYFYLSRPAEPINDLEVEGNYAFLAAGRAGLLVVDLSNPQAPRQIAQFDTLGNAKAVEVDDGIAYVADGGAGLRIVDVSTPTAPREVGALNTQGSAEDVALSGRFAYVAAGRAGLLPVDIGNPERPRPAGEYVKVDGGARRVATGSGLLALGDGRDNLRVLSLGKPRQPEELGNLSIGEPIQSLLVRGEWIYLAALKAGMLVVGVSDPKNPAKLAEYNQLSDAQDVAVLGAIYAYVANGQNGLSVLDISNLEAIEQVGVYRDLVDAVQVAANPAHIYVADKDAGLYVLQPDVQVQLDLVTPDEPQRGAAVDVAVSGRYAYVASEGRGLQVLDVEDPTQPREVTIYDTPGEATGVTVSGDFIYLSVGKEGLQILFLSAPATGPPEIQEEASVDSLGEARAVAISASGAFVYLADGSAGLQVINITDPKVPLQAGFQDTPGEALGVAVSGDYAYVADGEGGLRVINIVDPARPAEVGFFDTPGEAQAVVVVQLAGTPERRLAYVADGGGGLRVIDVSDPFAPVEIGAFTNYEYVEDVAVVGITAYLAAQNLGLRILNIGDPTNMSEVGALDTPGQARALDLIGHYAYLADYTRGLRVADVANPAAPTEVGFYDRPRIVNGVTVSGDYAYVADGERGFRIEDISRPSQPVEVGYFTQASQVNDIVVRDQIAYIADLTGLQMANVSDPKAPFPVGRFGTPGVATAVSLVENYAFIANGDYGLRVAYVDDPAAVQSVGSYDTAGIAQDVAVSGIYTFIADGPAGLNIANISDPAVPKTASLVDQFQDARSVVVIGDYVFLADGVNGIWVIDVAKPVIPQTIASLDTPGTALDLASAGVYLFVADGDKGVQVIYILDPYNPLLVGSLEIPGESLDLDVRWQPAGEGDSGSFNVYVARGNRGLGVLSATRQIDLLVVGRYESPGLAPIRQVMGDSTGSEKTRRTVGVYIIDIFLIGLAGFLFWMGFFAQFALPLHTLSDRFSAFNRLVLYLMGGHGPAVRIENGQVVQRQGERKRSGPGVVLLDTASAALLRSKTAFMRPIGPGVVFTTGGEFLHGESIDLHIQNFPMSAPLGPFQNEDPFAARKKNEKPEEYQARQRRRLETSALTRDGVEVVANLAVRCKIHSQQGQGGTQFGYDPDSVRRAITREGVVPQEVRNMPWYEIPAYLAVEVWREYLGKFTVNELFDIESALTRLMMNGTQAGGTGSAWLQTGETSLETAAKMVRLRMTQAEVPELDSYGQPTGDMQPSQEFRLLNDMGVEVKAAAVFGLRFPAAVEAQLVQQWLSTWLERAMAERERIEQAHSLAALQGKEAALTTFAQETVRDLERALNDEHGQPLPDGHPNVPGLERSLELLLLSTQRLLIQDVQLRGMLADEEARLTELLAWVRS